MIDPQIAAMSEEQLVAAISRHFETNYPGRPGLIAMATGGMIRLNPTTGDYETLIIPESDPDVGHYIAALNQIRLARLRTEHATQASAWAVADAHEATLPPSGDPSTAG